MRSLVSSWCRVAAVLVLGVLPGSAAAKGPNILVLVADDLGWRDVGYHGSEISTPNLDRLARGGVRLERHYVYPTCSPTRAGLLTGRNPSRFGIHGPIADRSTDALPRDAVTLARVLEKQGYETALFGKWHLGLTPEVGPRQYGFRRTYGYLHGQIDQLTHRYKNGDRTWHRDDVFLDEPGHATDLISAEALRFLGTKRKGPFFLWVAFSVPHHPVQEEERRVAPYRATIENPSRRLYAAAVSHMDEAVGRIVAALEAAGQAKDTLVVFTSDNGGQKDYASKTEYGGKHGPYATLGDNRPWRGWKGSLYEGGVRVPAFASWPGRLAPREVKEAVSYLDWFPTLAAAAGVAPDPGWKLEGRNLGDLLRGEGKLPPPVLTWDTGRAEAVVAGDWKLIVTRKTGEAELYHLTEDPGEKANLAGREPEKVQNLRKVLAEQRAAGREP